MTPQRWVRLSEDQRAVALVKYYAAGKEGMEDDFVRRGGNPATYTGALMRDLGLGRAAILIIGRAG